MKIIYVSTLISEKKMNYIISNSKSKPLQSVQKYHRLLCEGLVKNGVNVETLSAIPMSRKISNKIIWFDKKEKENGIIYNYLPFINIRFLRQIFISVSIFFNIIKECLKRDCETMFVCDILNTTISFITLMLSRVLRFKCLAIATDLPRDMGNEKSISTKINVKLQSKYDGYVLLTEAMNNMINTKNKPYIIIEGIADIGMQEKNNNLQEKYNSKVCIYAGGLYKKYGIKSLIDAFLQLDMQDIELHLYGSGDLEKYIKEIEDKRIKFLGVVQNDILVKEEIKSTLLINPRFTNEEYTKYSFPSKNMEYMASGTAVLTTKLPGMPREYCDYVYVIEDETIKGIKTSLYKVLSQNVEEINNKGILAKKFVIENKNNIVQAKKIISFMKKV